MLNPQQSLNCRGRLLTLDRPRVMGILNVTPDSFYDGGRYQNIPDVVRRAGQLLEEGADLLDIGGMSSRPGAEIIPVEEEKRRVLPAIEAILKEFPEALLSIDTIHAAVAVSAIEAGAVMVNDISAGSLDPQLFPSLPELGAPYVLMHMQGRPQTMHLNPEYEDVVREVLDFFIEQVGRLRALGVYDIILDPGFGFGKKIQHSYQLLKNLHVFKILDLPILVGISRKSMVYRLLGSSPEEALYGTTGLHMAALMQGASILRVHDVRPAVDVIRCWQQLQDA